MHTTLPPNPDIDQIRRRAKELLRSAREGDPQSLERLRDSIDPGQQPKLADAQRTIAGEYGFASWPRLRTAVADATPARAGLQATQPVFADKSSSSESLFTAAGFMERAQSAGWEPGPLPDAILFTFHPAYAQLLDEDARFERNTNLAPGNSTMFTTIEDQPRIGVTCLSPGATAMVGQVENQVALNGAKRFMIMGTAGSIHPDVRPGTVVVVESAVRDDGISQHYLPPDTYVDADPELSERLLSALQEQGVAAETGATWTVPTPYRSTPTEVEQLASEGVAVVECEVASLLAVAEALGVSAGACLAVTSSLVGHEHDPTALTPSDPRGILKSALAALGLRTEQ